MKKHLLYLFCILLVAFASYAFHLHGSGVSGGEGGTNWTADPNMKALYYFEDGNFSSGTVDSDGNNDLGIGTYEAPAVNTTNYIEGSQSATFEAAGTDSSFIITHTGLDADFPGMGSGDSEITMAGWVRITTYGASNYWATIQDNDPLVDTAAIYESDASGSLTAAVDGTNGSASVTSTVDCSINTWYFVGLSYSDSATELRIYVRQQGGGSSTWNTTTADLNDLEDISGNGVWYIGNNSVANAPYGDADGWAVFNGDALTQAELDGVFSNGWDGNGW